VRPLKVGHKLIKRLAILGSTGSIGRQTLEVVREFPERFQITALAAGSNLELLIEQAVAFRPQYLVIGHEDLYPEVKRRLAEVRSVLPEITILAGVAGFTEVVTLPEVDLVVTAVVGSIGIKPTLAAITAGKTIALANKETLVAAGSVIIPTARKTGVRILPVDSEHSAIFQCLEGRSPAQVAKLWLTASGGPFRNYQPSQLASVTVEQALNHPNWRMGGKITIDSATMFNKGLEIIEAHWLFQVAFEQIKVVIHPESIIHSMVQLLDGSCIAQLGLCDMRLPIQYALTYPDRLPNSFPVLDFSGRIQLHFEPVNLELFPAIHLAYEAGRKGGSLPAALNAANEVAVEAFLKAQIQFIDIVRIVSEVMGYHQNERFKPDPDLDEILAVDTWARQTARRFVDN
jgi:1-deoxy-D-xylulose-5-phosphate reductoisomerase